MQRLPPSIELTNTLWRLVLDNEARSDSAEERLLKHAALISASRRGFDLKQVRPCSVDGRTLEAERCAGSCAALGRVL